ncbi:MAG TPA: nitrile hydratase accessory protein [Steroidobacteraceae bacterium]
MTPEALLRLPGMPLEADSPVFNEPWEARAFAMVLALHERGLFTWAQWAEALSRQIGLAQAAGDPDHGDTYYQHWLLALESLVRKLPA